MFHARAVRHQGVDRPRAAVVAIALVLLLSAVGAANPTAASAAEVLTQTATADATVLRLRPYMNYPSGASLHARAARAKFFMQFDLSAWYGRPIEQIELELTAVGGDSTTLELRRSGTAWTETGLTWRNRPGILATPVVRPTYSGTGKFRVSLASFFSTGTVDRHVLSLEGRTSSSDGVWIGSRESSASPTVFFLERSATETSLRRPSPDTPLRFYTPNIFASGDAATPARDTDRSHLASLFTDQRTVQPLLENVDVLGFFGASIGKLDPEYDAMLRRAIGMLKANGVKLSIEVGGPLGYAPPVVYGADDDGANGRKSALFDLRNRVYRVEAMGGRVDYLMLDGALRRTISNGANRNPHAAFLTVGGTGSPSRLSFRARSAGAAGNSIQIAFVNPGPGSPLTIRVSGTTISVGLATDTAGRSITTALDVKAAMELTPAAAALVLVGIPAGSSGAGVVTTMAPTSLQWGDDGLNMTIGESVSELVSYMKTIHANRPGIRFVLLEDVVLWPYDGRPGYASAAFPGGQRPDFKIVWEELMQQVRSAGLTHRFVAMHNDVSVEYLDRLVPSIHRDADDWYGRILKQQAQVEASGLAFGQLFNSLWGGTPIISNRASDSYFQSQVLHHVDALESYRLANRPNLGQMKHFHLDAFMFYPRVVGPYTRANSTDDTYLQALERFLDFRRAQSAVLPLAA